LQFQLLDVVLDCGQSINHGFETFGFVVVLLFDRLQLLNLEMANLICHPRDDSWNPHLVVARLGSDPKMLDFSLGLASFSTARRIVSLVGHSAKVCRRIQRLVTRQVLTVRGWKHEELIFLNALKRLAAPESCVEKAA